VARQDNTPKQTQSAWPRCDRPRGSKQRGLSRRVAGAVCAVGPPNISSSRPPGLAVAQVTGSRPAAAEQGRWAAEDCISPSHGSLFHQQVAVVAMAQHGVPADRLGVRLGVCFR
jgi:hypothetical protein